MIKSFLDIFRDNVHTEVRTEQQYKTCVDLMPPTCGFTQQGKESASLGRWLQSRGDIEWQSKIVEGDDVGELRVTYVFKARLTLGWVYVESRVLNAPDKDEPLLKLSSQALSPARVRFATSHHSSFPLVWCFSSSFCRRFVVFFGRRRKRMRETGGGGGGAWKTGGISQLRSCFPSS